MRAVRLKPVLPGALRNEIEINSFRPGRCVRLLYRYDRRYFRYIMRKLGVQRPWYQMACKYFAGEGSNEWRRDIALSDEFYRLGKLIIAIAQNDDYFAWLFSISHASRQMLLADQIFSWKEYKAWLKARREMEVAPIFTSVDKALQETSIRYQVYKARSSGEE